MSGGCLGFFPSTVGPFPPVQHGPQGCQQSDELGGNKRSSHFQRLHQRSGPLVALVFQDFFSISTFFSKRDDLKTREVNRIAATVFPPKRKTKSGISNYDIRCHVF